MTANSLQFEMAESSRVAAERLNEVMRMKSLLEEKKEGGRRSSCSCCSQGGVGKEGGGGGRSEATSGGGKCGIPYAWRGQ